jgi:plasmid replication initiation protein
MARKKTDTGTLVNGLNTNYIVEKSRPLGQMRAVNFTLGEYKVLDTYLSRINARDEKNRTVRFTKEEYEQLMNIKQARPEDLEKSVSSLMKHIVTVPLGNGEWKKYTLFSVSSFTKDKKTEQWWVELTCTEEAKKLFFNIETIGYLHYQLKNIINLSSKYSVLLYGYLLDRRKRGLQWSVSVEYLKKYVFQCDEVETYAKYKRFREFVLEKSLQEVNEKTDLEFAIKPIRTGRIITDIEFTLVKDDVVEYEPYEQLSLDDEASEQEAGIFEKLAKATKNEFSTADLQLLYEIMRHKDGVERYGYDNYLQVQYQYMLTQNAKKPVKFRFNYLQKAVQEDYAKVLKKEDKKSQPSFNYGDFADRTLDKIIQEADEAEKAAEKKKNEGK